MRYTWNVLQYECLGCFFLFIYLTCNYVACQGRHITYAFKRFVGSLMVQLTISVDRMRCSVSIYVYPWSANLICKKKRITKIARWKISHFSGASVSVDSYWNFYVQFNLQRWRTASATLYKHTMFTHLEGWADVMGVR